MKLSGSLFHFNLACDRAQCFFLVIDWLCAMNVCDQNAPQTKFTKKTKMKSFECGFGLIAMIVGCYLMQLHKVDASFNYSSTMGGPVNSSGFNSVQFIDNGNHKSMNFNQSKRNGKFLFDALFGIEQPALADEDDDDDNDTGSEFKKCNCGKC